MSNQNFFYYNGNTDTYAELNFLKKTTPQEIATALVHTVTKTDDDNMVSLFDDDDMDIFYLAAKKESLMKFVVSCIYDANETNVKYLHLMTDKIFIQKGVNTMKTCLEIEGGVYFTVDQESLLKNFHRLGEEECSFLFLERDVYNPIPRDAQNYKVIQL